MPAELRFEALLHSFFKWMRDASNLWSLVGDRHGLQLFTCALDRATGIARWER